MKQLSNAFNNIQYPEFEFSEQTTYNRTLENIKMLIPLYSNSDNGNGVKDNKNNSSNLKYLKELSSS